MTSNLTAGSAWSSAGSADTEAARAAAEQLQHAADRVKAVRVVAAVARNSAEASELFEMLGLRADEIRAAARGTVAA